MRDFKWENYPRRILRDHDPWLPFPGIYPTRWAIDMRWGPDRKTGYTHKWRYLGKPNSGVAQFVQSVILTARFSETSAIEFVRNGAIASSYSHGPRSNFAIRDWCQNKFRLVDPWQGYPNGHMITHWASLSMRPLPLIYKGHKFVIYTTQAAITTSRLEAHRDWLDTVNIAFSRQ